MLSTKPYLIRAIFEWCVDQGFTPYLSVVVDGRARVPREYVRDGQIVLNVGAEATQGLMIGNEEISFQARFNGVAFSVVVPVDVVAAIYARENGQGMAFEVSGEAETEDSESPAAVEPAEPEVPEAPSNPPGGRPRLTRVK